MVSFEEHTFETSFERFNLLTHRALGNIQFPGGLCQGRAGIESTEIGWIVVDGRIFQPISDSEGLL